MNRLKGITILVTRAKEQACELTEPLEKLGAKILLQPALEIRPTQNFPALDSALSAIVTSDVDWALFSSANGVRATMARLCAQYFLEESDCDSFFRNRGIKTAVVGPGTGKALAEFGIEPTVIPERFDAEGLIEALDKVVDDYPSQYFLSFRANRGRDVLRRQLCARGARYQEVEAYRSVDVTTADPAVLRALNDGKIDATIVMSSASAKALVAIFGEAARKTRWFAISLLTAGALEECGIKAERVAKESTIASLVEAVVETFANAK
ncbi:MAG: uroporphyrinogen-III synthase [Thermoguttaceae bacterium]